MKRSITPALAVGVFATCAVPLVQAQPLPANPNVQVYYTTPLEHDSSRVVRLQSVTIPPSQGNNFHRHNGDQWAAIQEGEVTFTVKGQTPRVLKAGDSVYIPRGTIHRNQNLSDKPARSIELLIMDKDKPALEQVPD